MIHSCGAPSFDHHIEEVRFGLRALWYYHRVARVGKLSQGELEAQSAFRGGKLKLKGNMGLAMKLTPILASVGGAPKL